MNKPSSTTSNGSSASPCVISQSIIVILVPFSNLNRTFAMGILFRCVIGLLTTTSMGIPTLSLQVNYIVTFEEKSRLVPKKQITLVCTAGHSDASMPCYYQRSGDSISSSDKSIDGKDLQMMMDVWPQLGSLQQFARLAFSCFQLQIQSDFL